MSLVEALVLLAAFFALVAIMIVTVIWAVEKGLTIRWKGIKQDFDRLSMALDGLDTLQESVKQQSEDSASKIAKAVELVTAIKAKVDDHESRIHFIEELPVIRPVGGHQRVIR